MNTPVDTVPADAHRRTTQCTQQYPLMHTTVQTHAPQQYPHAHAPQQYYYYPDSRRPIRSLV
eukprot:3855693-Rhodomonas_salina.3